MVTQITITCERCRRVDSRQGRSLVSAILRTRALGLAGWAVRCEGGRSADLCPRCAGSERPRIHNGRADNQ